MNKKARGISIVHWLLIAVVVILVIGTGWYVLNSQDNLKTSRQDTAKKVTNKIEAIKPSETADPYKVTASSIAHSPTTDQTSDLVTEPEFLTYKTTYEGLEFLYPSDWKVSEIDGNSNTSDAVTIFSPDRGVLINLGLPVDESVVSQTCGQDDPKPSITSAQAINDTKLEKQLYLIHYTWSDTKYLAVTDGGGTEPNIGESNICSHPVYTGRHGDYVWLRVTTNDAYRELSEAEFYNHPYIKAAEAALLSTKYQ